MKINTLYVIPNKYWEKLLEYIALTLRSFEFAL